MTIAIPASIWKSRFSELGRPLIVGHRGCGTARENSRAAFELAIALGADAVETDLRLSKDGVPVCAHDASVKGHAGELEISETDIGMIESLDPLVVRFREAQLEGRPVYLDVKETDIRLRLHLMDALELPLSKVDAIVGVDSFDWCCEVSRHFPSVHVVALMKDEATILRIAADVPRAWVRLHQWRTCPAEVERYRSAGLGVMVTCGQSERSVGDMSAEGCENLRMLAPDAIVVNDVASAARTFRSQ